MQVQWKPLYGAAGLAVFITGCMALMLHALRLSIGIWAYARIFALSVFGIYQLAVRLLGDTAGSVPKTSNAYDELGES